MARKNKFDYFGALETATGYACDEAKTLKEVFRDYDPAKIMDIMTAIHKIENDADAVNHEIFDHIATEFITVIDRDDILDLAQRIDEVVDCIDDVSLKLFMYNVQKIDSKYALEMTDLIDKETNALRVAMIDFKNFKKSDALDQLLIDVSDYEERADKVYIDAIHELYSTPGIDPVQVTAWTNLYSDLEKCCDSCAHVADLMKTVIIKNA